MLYNIKKLNKISGVVYDHLPKDKYLVSSHIVDEETDAYIVRSADCLGMELPEALIAIARAGAGVNNIPVDRCTENGVVVFNTPGANANAVKELVLCGLLIASRDVVGGIEWAKTLAGRGDEIPALVEAGKKQFTGRELAGKNLGVIGLGAIGVMVSNAATALDMNVIGYDPFISVESAWHLSQKVHRALTLDELLQNSDYITLHIPLIDKTRDFISSPEFDKMREGVVLMNFSRDGIIRTSSLFEALDSGKISRFVSDFPSDELLSRNNVITIPHLGASTPESEENCAAMAAKQLRDFIETGSIKNSVNMPECLLTHSSAHRISLIHLNLPNMVGQMTAILASESLNIEEMTNKSRGSIAYTVFDLNTKPSLEVFEALGCIEGVIKIREVTNADG